MNIHFICNRNKWRSPAAGVYKNDKVYKIKFTSTEPGARARATAKLSNWADIILWKRT
ncbi:MAG: hypothetical protein ACXWWC_03185 [Chitinophagaceae bacterium]